MEVHLTSSQQAKLNELAAATGRGTDEVVQEAIDRLLSYEQWFRDQVQAGLDQANRSEFVEDEEVRARIDRKFKS